MELNIIRADQLIESESFKSWLRRPHTRQRLDEAIESRALTSLTWDVLVAIDPRLYDLDQQARTTSSLPWDIRWYGGWINRVWFGGMKTEMSEIVGKTRPELDWLLSSSRAYDIAYEHLLDLIDASSPPEEN